MSTWKLRGAPRIALAGSVAVAGGVALQAFDARIAIWGQSNAYGRAERADIAASPLSVSDPGLTTLDAGTFNRVWIWTGSAYEKLQPSVNNGADAGQFGPEFGIAVRWERETASGNLYLEKAALGGVSITYFDPASPEYAGFKTEHLQGNTWLTTAGPGGTPVTLAYNALLWVQGESDVGQTQSWYQTRMAALIAARVSDGLMASGDVSLLAQIFPGTAGYDANITAAKAALAAATPTTVKTINFASYYKPDNIHLDARGQVQMGYDTFAAVFGAGSLAA